MLRPFQAMLVVFAVYLVAHFLAYVVLRRSAALRSEMGILSYHFGSALLVGAAGLAIAMLDPVTFGVAGLVLVLAAHGIYSLSFLELWSLAQGGYSLSVIASIARAEASGSAADFSGLERIGQAKQNDRIAGLEKLGLVARSGAEIALTARGRKAACMLHALLAWVDPHAKS